MLWQFKEFNSLLVQYSANCCNFFLNSFYFSLRTLYCAKGNYEFGVSRIIKSLEPYQKKVVFCPNFFFKFFIYFTWFLFIVNTIFLLLWLWILSKFEAYLCPKFILCDSIFVTRLQNRLCFNVIFAISSLVQIRGSMQRDAFSL